MYLLTDNKNDVTLIVKHFQDFVEKKSENIN